jgi:hypothetical protein
VPPWVTLSACASAPRSATELVVLAWAQSWGLSSDIKSMLGSEVQSADALEVSEVESVGGSQV